MSWSLKGSYFETCSCDLMCPCNMLLGVERAPFEVVEEGLRHIHPVSSEFNAAEAKRSRISAFGIEYEGKTGISASEFAWAA